MKINEIYYNKKKISSDTNKIIKYIQTYCSDFLPIYKKFGPLFRGMQGSENVATVWSSPVGRQPKDTDRLFQKAIDKKLKEAGFTALRSNSAFCTSSHRFASQFNDTHIIFPKNGFTYTWCPTDDLTEKYQLLNNWNNCKYQYIEFLKTKKIPRNADSSFNFYVDLKNMSPENFINKYKFTNKNLGEAIIKNYEVYIHGKYVAINDYYFNKIISMVNYENK